MPDTRRLPYSENTLSYSLFVDDEKEKGKTLVEDEGLLIQSDVITCANGSSYVEYKGAKVMVAAYGPKDIQRREDFTLDGLLKVDLSYCLFSNPERRLLPAEMKQQERHQSQQLTEALSSVIQLKRYPKSQIDVCVQVLECGISEQATMAAMVTSAGCALAAAGLDMFGLVVGAGDESAFVAMMPELNQITGLVATDDVSIGAVVKEARSVYPHLYRHFVAAE